jgi:hypothetical protein
LSDPVEPQPFTRRGWLLLALAALLLMLPTLFYPLGHDQAMFYLSGRKILEGAIHYRDIVDIKPPLIYHLYALAILLFGKQISSIRILDMILQLGTGALVCLTIRRASRSDLWGALSTVIYLMLYVGLSYGAAAQTESYTGLLGFGVFHMILFRRTTPGFLLAGILIGLLFLLKLPLGIVLAVVLLGELLLFDAGPAAAGWNILRVTAGFLIPVAAAVVYLVAFDAFDDFMMMNDFIRGYSGQQLQSVPGVVRSAIEQIPEYLVNQYSLVMITLTLAGGALSLTRPSPTRSRDTLLLLRLSTMAFVLLLLSIVVEAKFTASHFARVYAVGVVLGTYALLQIFRRIRMLRSDGAYRWFAIPLVVILIAFFSPLLRYVHHTGAAVAYLRGGDRGIDRYYGGSKTSYTRGEILDIADYLHAHERDHESVYVFSAHAGLVYQLLDLVPPHKIFHMAFVVAPFAPKEWRQSTARHIIDTRPAYIAIQTNDSIPDLIGVSTTSAQGIAELPGVGPVLRSEYGEALRTEHFVLLQRIKR